MNESVQQMIDDSNAETAPLAEFVEDYWFNDNLWWLVDEGFKQNLFEAAIEELASINSAWAQLINYLREPQPVEDLIEMAWIIISNSTDWNINEEWTKAAIKWRDDYHAWIERTTTISGDSIGS